ncbi:MAG: tRNA pseudouridine(38-40) synthase TruA [Candidatus Babeliales bacterium]
MYYKLIVAYDGAAYAGWQVQPTARTVAGTLQETFQTVFGASVTMVGASRTDAGVHAVYQVVRVRTDMAIEAAQLMRAWNNRLPVDIVIRSCVACDDTFHPQRNVQQKTYWYHVFAKRPLPQVSRYGYYYRYPFSEEKLRAVLQLFVGTHNFAAFCVAREYDDTVRTIDVITLSYCRRLYAWRIEVRGKSFLHFMIRRIVGAALAIASHPDLSTHLITNALKTGSVAAELPKAPAQGLLLRAVRYESN